jgi:hypothetical protein
MHKCMEGIYQLSSSNAINFSGTDFDYDSYILGQGGIEIATLEIVVAGPGQKKLSNDYSSVFLKLTIVQWEQFLQ